MSGTYTCTAKKSDGTDFTPTITKSVTISAQCGKFH